MIPKHCEEMASWKNVKLRRRPLTPLKRIPITLKKKKWYLGRMVHPIISVMSLRGAGLWSKTLSKTWRREVRPREGGQERQRNKGNTLKRDWKYNVTAENIEIFEMHNAREKSPIRINHQKDQRMPVLKHLSCLHANHSGWRGWGAPCPNPPISESQCCFGCVCSEARASNMLSMSYTTELNP